MFKTTKYGIIGAGKVGLSVAELLFTRGKLSFIFDNNADSIPNKLKSFYYSSLSELPKCDFVYIAIPDTFLKILAKDIQQQYKYVTLAVFAHSSGVMNAAELSQLSESGAEIAAIHPYQTFAFADKDNLKDISWCIECKDSSLEKCVEFVECLGGKHHRLEYGNVDQKVLYHCSAVMSSNNMTTLLQTGKLIAEKAGVPPKAFIAPIAQKTLDNNLKAFSDKSIPLTGPIARADAKAITFHLNSIEDPSVIRIYCYSALATLELSLREKIINPESFLEIENILKTAIEKSLNKKSR